MKPADIWCTLADIYCHPRYGHYADTANIARASDVAERLTDRGVKVLPPPASGTKPQYDAELQGFALRITVAGARAFVLN